MQGKYEQVIEKLTELKFDQSFLLNYALPSWWDDELNTKSASVLELAGCLSQRLGVPCGLLLGDESLDNVSINTYRSVVSAIGEFISKGMPQPYQPLQENFKVDELFPNGIAIVRLDHAPNGGFLPSGCVYKSNNGRVIIFISNKECYYLWIGLTLATLELNPRAIPQGKVSFQDNMFGVNTHAYAERLSGRLSKGLPTFSNINKSLESHLDWEKLGNNENLSDFLDLLLFS